MKYLFVAFLLLFVSCADDDELSHCQFQVTWYQENNDSIGQTFCAENIENQFESTNLTVTKTTGEIVIFSGKFNIRKTQ